MLSKRIKNAVLGVKKWWSANVFLTTNGNMFAGNILVNSEGLLSVLEEHIISTVKCVEVHKMSEDF